jgi:hypothetical protein
MRKITLYTIMLLVLPALAFTQSISGNITKKAKVCQFKAGIELIQKSPSQLSPLASVGFTLTKASKVSLTICDADDKEIITLLNEELTAGYHSVRHYIPANTSVTYYYHFTAEAGTRKISKKVQIIQQEEFVQK